MTSPRPLPSLFGRFNALFRDHDHLAKTLRRLRLMCAALEAGQTSLPEDLSPKALLVQLHADLAEHFATEESPDYFGTVIEEAPALGTQVAGLKWEHLTMLRGADVLCQLADDCSRWPHLAGPTRELIGQLERHERSESSLLRDLFRHGD